MKLWEKNDGDDDYTPPSRSHTLSTSLDGLKEFGISLSAGSVAKWARVPARVCLIFVHGYGGLPTKTWGDFPEMAVVNPAFAQADLLFLGYESRSRAAAFNVAVIYKVVTCLAEEPQGVIERILGPSRPKGFAYESIVLVGHSLGGALVRDVAMSAKSEGKAWADKLRLALFAPAHMGASIVDLAHMGFGFLNWLGAFEAIAILINPVLQDLRPGSGYLKALLATAQEIGEHCTTKAKLVAHASGDKVVILNRFYRDPPPEPYEGQDHVSCCKPVWKQFLQPVADVAKVLV